MVTPLPIEIFRAPKHLYVKTDGQWYQFLDRTAVPFNILDKFNRFLPLTESFGFLYYDGRWFHYSQFFRAPINSKGWDGILGMDRGLAIRISEDGLLYQIGEYSAIPKFSN